MTMKDMYKICFVMLLCLAWVGCSSIIDEEDQVVERVKVGESVPSFTVETVIPTEEGNVSGTFSTGRLTGETVIVFFHTGCSDCQRDLPLLNEYYVQHKGDDGFQMVAISRAEGAESVADFWSANNLQIPYSAQEDRRIYELFATSIIPRIYFVSRAGIVTHVDVEKYVKR